MHNALTHIACTFSGIISVSQRESHIVVACGVHCTGLQELLLEFFHEDHGSQYSRVCILAPGEPSISVQELILK